MCMYLHVPYSCVPDSPCPRCNDKENDRLGYDSILSERALREIYLMPFMLAQKYAKPWCFMTA